MNNTTCYEIRDAMLRYLAVAPVIADHPHRLAMDDWHCGTAHCWAGWMEVALYGGEVNEADEDPRAFVISHDIGNLFGMAVNPGSLHVGRADVPSKAWRILFGPCNGEGEEALHRQVRRANLLLFRAERYIEALESMSATTPRAKRQDHHRVGVSA